MIKQQNQAKLKRAKELDAKMKNLRVAFRRHWTIYGEIAVQFEKDELYKLLGHGSMKHYLKSLDKACYSTIAEAMAVIKSLPEMNTKVMALYPKENLKILAKLPERQRQQKTVLEACRNLKTREFRAMLNEKKNLHLEAKVPVRFDVEASEVVVIDTAIDDMQKQAKKKLETDDDVTRSQAFVFICLNYLQKRGLL